MEEKETILIVHYDANPSAAQMAEWNAMWKELRDKVFRKILEEKKGICF